MHGGVVWSSLRWDEHSDGTSQPPVLTATCGPCIRMDVKVTSIPTIWIIPGRRGADLSGVASLVSVRGVMEAPPSERSNRRSRQDALHCTPWVAGAGGARALHAPCLAAHLRAPISHPSPAPPSQQVDSAGRQCWQGSLAKKPSVPRIPFVSTANGTSPLARLPPDSSVSRVSACRASRRRRRCRILPNLRSRLHSPFFPSNPPPALRPPHPPPLLSSSFSPLSSSPLIPPPPLRSPSALPTTALPSACEAVVNFDKAAGS
ncbi:hypothetical protein CDD80_5057 [Ophiocordyceps camponoti-rufipedis]|uniref:Uncharacterized protein n=1 Tax=Ophiocordyceps camponoti-rufipedis TaxID=2004952 RepID=A0A2C5YWH7_9HYPO|nr:hypothetical protein CDD80_5057 [Ophiocordyceps camponoti-rufipedis]